MIFFRRGRNRHPNRSYHNWLLYKTGDRFLLDHATLLRGLLVDLGCGESSRKGFFLKYAENYIGVDWGESLHAVKPDILAYLNKPLNIPANFADTIVSFSVIEHLHAPQLFLNESFRILKPGGHMLLQVPWQWRVHEEPHDYFRFTPFALNRMLATAGFRNVLVKPHSGFFTMLIIKLNYFSLRLIRGPLVWRWLIRLFLIPFWSAGQVVAPLLDMLDSKKELECQSYFVVAGKQLDV